MDTQIVRGSVELLADIAEFTEPSDLCAFRLTCRAIYQITLRHFAQTFLHTLKTDLSPKSFARIEEAANNEVFRLCVRKLEITRNRDGYWGPRCTDATLNEASIQAWRDVMKRLVNCRSFEVRNSTYTTPHCGSDGITFDEATGLVLKAIATGSIPMESFSIDIAKYRSRPHQDSLTQFTITTFGITAFSHLKELSLVIPDAEAETIGWMAKLIQCAKSLRKLTILFGWKCESTSLLSQISSVGCLPELQELTFSRMSIQSSAALGMFLYSIRNSLRAATFSFVQLEDGGWRSILRELGGGGYRLDSLILHRILELDKFLSFGKIPEYPLAERSLDRKLYRPLQFCFVRQQDVGFSYSGPDLWRVVQRVAALIELS
ncbi:unnamed protein product [Penicillium glandicola]